MTPEQLAAIEARRTGVRIAVEVNAGSDAHRGVEAIARLVNKDMPALLAEVKRLQAKNARLTEELDNANAAIIDLAARLDEEGGGNQC